MNNSIATPFDNHFHISVANIDPGLLLIEVGERFSGARAYFDYQYETDTRNGLNIDVVEVKPNSCETLPGSVRNRSKVVYVGIKPIFAALDSHNNLLTYIFFGSVIRVEYLGQKGKRRKIKYFKCF